MLNINEIQELPRTEVMKQSGVYFLLDGNNVTYVGQSSNIQLRVGQHRVDKTKVFTKYAWIPCPNYKERLALEKSYIEYIKTCKPPW